MITFEDWYIKLLKLAKAQDLLFLVSTEPEDHRQAYIDGSTPSEELHEQKYESGLL